MQKRAHVLSEAEIAQVLKRHTGAREQLAFMLGHLAGLRVFEIAQLRIGDVIRKDWTVEDQLHIQGKGDIWRSVPISERLRGYIRRALPNNYKLDAPLVPGRHGGFFNASALSHWFTLRYEEAGIRAKGNSGRRSFMTRMKRKKVDLRTIQELAGHADLGTTMRYLAVDDDEMRDAVALL